MSGKSRNEGVRTIAQFRDRAIPMGKTPPASVTETKNDGIQPPADFSDPVPPVLRPQDDSGKPNTSPPGEAGPTSP